METENWFDSDDYNAVMIEAMESENKYEADVNRHNDRLLSALGSVMSAKWMKSLGAVLAEVDGSFGKYEIVSKPRGEWQDENFGAIRGAWVDQWAVGDSGDSFHGFYTVGIRKGKYLQIEYSC